MGGWGALTTALPCGSAAPALSLSEVLVLGVQHFLQQLQLRTPLLALNTGTRQDPALLVCLQPVPAPNKGAAMLIALACNMHTTADSHKGCTEATTRRLAPPGMLSLCAQELGQLLKGFPVA